MPAGGAGGDDAKNDQDFMKLTRRRIYFNRLVGDLDMGQKSSARRRMPWRVVLKFLFYAAVASIFIVGRSDIEVQSETNIALKDAFRKSAWAGGPIPSYFDDIENVHDVLNWLSYAILPQVFHKAPLIEDFSFLSHNRVMPAYPATDKGTTPSIQITMRQMATEAKYNDTTTARFNSLYPETWKQSSIATGSEQGDAEYKAPLVRTYTVLDKSGMAEGTPLPSGRHGKDENGALITSKPAVGSKVTAEWKHTDSSKKVGHAETGGYVATIALELTDAQRAILNNEATDAHVISQNIILEQLVTLAPPETTADIMGQASSDGSLPDVLRLGDFFVAEFADRQTTSVAVDFLLYNANSQTMSRVTAKFAWHSGGTIAQRELRVETLVLDIYKTLFGIPFFWPMVIYCIFTAGYLLQLLLQLYKYGRNGSFFKSFWSYCNFLSILSSVTSLAYWMNYEKTHQATFLGLDTGDANDATIDMHLLDARLAAFRLFSRTSSFATLTIFLRILQFLSDTTPRVKLLLRTMSLAMGNMVIYVSFIGVIFFGFTAFAMTHFSLYSLEYASPDRSVVSNFALFMGDVAKADSAKSALLQPYYVLVFMSVFFLVSVQMFNAIINYSYNKASEDMEPQFEKERLEKKRKEISRKSSPNRLAPLWKCLSLLTRGGGKAKEESEAQKDESAAADKKVKTAATVGTVSLEALDPITKERVEKYLTQGQDQKPIDGPVAILAFFCFALSYLLFLFFNLAITDNFILGQSLGRSMRETGIQRRHPDGSTLLFNMRNVESISDLDIWFTEVLPLIVHGQGDLPPQLNPTVTTEGDLGTGDEEPVNIIHADQRCANSFNCFVTSEETGRCGSSRPGIPCCGGSILEDTNRIKSPKKILRITNREIKRKINEGEKTPETPKDPGNRFTHGKDYLPMRGSHQPISASADFPANREREDAVTKFQTNNNVFCHRVPKESGGFRDAGGLECLLDADPASFQAQIDMLKQGFISRETSSVTLEFTIHNGHLNMLYSGLFQFTVLPCGQVLKHDGSISFLVMDLGLIGEMDTLLRLLFGLMYLVFVLYFTWKFYRDLLRELTRKSHETKSQLSTFIEFLTGDIFNLLDAVSICLSILSSTLFILWVLKQGSMNCQHDGPYSKFVTYVDSVAAQGKTYNQISALNTLVIFVRPLQFLRENPRMAKLFNTIQASVNDISWFVVMLFITMLGFVMMAYISFGSGVQGLSTILAACTYCFYYILGNFEFKSLKEVDPIMAPIFFFPYLLLFYCMFQNLFFAIIDRNFIAADPPAENWRKKLKPIFGKLCWCLEWDEDYVMEADPNANPKEGPPSRSDRVHSTAVKIQELEEAYGDSSGGTISKKAKQLSDVCDMDDRLTEVLHWSREEAKKFVDKYQALLTRKQENKSNDENFIKNEVMPEVRKESNDAKKDMDDEQRKMIYAIQVHENMAMQDQEMLARYILLLEYKIKKKMAEKYGLRQEVHHLRGESEKMRYTDEEFTKLNSDEIGHRLAKKPQAVIKDDKGGGLENGALGDKDGDSEDDEDEVAQAPQQQSNGQAAPNVDPDAVNGGGRAKGNLATKLGN